MVLSIFLVLLLFIFVLSLFLNCRSKWRQNETNDKTTNIPSNRSNIEISQICDMKAMRLGRNPFALISVLLAILLHVKTESDQNKLEIEKLKKEAYLHEQEIKQMKKDYENKGPRKCDWNESERMITHSCPSLPNQPQMPSSSFDPDDPFFDICGFRISLQGHGHPDTVTIQHSLPSDLEHFESLRQESRDFNKTIEVGDITINVHKDLLGARIPFFMNLLSPNWIESSSEIISLSNEYDSTVIDCIINYAYTGRLTITQDTVQCLMKTASFLCMEEEVVGECYRFMKKRIEFDSALPLLYFCRAINYNTKDESLMKFIEANFVPISLTLEFLDLPFCDLLDILRSDSLNIDDERQASLLIVFDAINKWIGKDESRKAFGPRLLKLIHCPCLTPSFLNQIVSTKNWVIESPECIDIINETLGIGKNSNISLKNTRRNSNARNLIIVTSSNEDYDKHYDEYSKISLYDPLKNEWHHGFIACQKLYDDVAVVGEQVFFMGRKLNERTRRYEGSMIVLNSRTNQWDTLSMASHIDRSEGFHGVVDGKIFSAGGYLPHSVTLFDPTNPAAGWTKVSSLTISRQLSATCTLDGKFYVLGGITNGDHPEICEDGEYYDPATNEWTRISCMEIGRAESGAAALHGEIFLVGGGGVVGASSRILQKYSPKTDSWEKLSSMKHALYTPFVVASGGMLYVCGGTNEDQKHVPFMERYDPKTDIWEELDNIPEFPKRPIMWTVPIPASYPTPNLEAEERIKFKLAFNGTEHRFASILRGDQLFNSMKNHIAENFKKEEFEIF